MVTEGKRLLACLRLWKDEAETFDSSLEDLKLELDRQLRLCWCCEAGLTFQEALETFHRDFGRFFGWVEDLERWVKAWVVADELGASAAVWQDGKWTEPEALDN